jgi:hypothetical protein
MGASGRHLHHDDAVLVLAELRHRVGLGDLPDLEHRMRGMVRRVSSAPRSAPLTHTMMSVCLTRPGACGSGRADDQEIGTEPAHQLEGIPRVGVAWISSYEMRSERSGRAGDVRDGLVGLRKEPAGDEIEEQQGDEERPHKDLLSSNLKSVAQGARREARPSLRPAPRAFSGRGTTCNFCLSQLTSVAITSSRMRFDVRAVYPDGFPSGSSMNR